MKYRITYLCWLVLFVLCAGLGFLPKPEGAASAALTALSVLFFVPGALVLFWAHREGQTGHIHLVRNLAAWSLGVTVVLLVANLLSALGSDTLGNVLYALLVVMGAPLVCSQIYALSLFLWACLLMTGIYLSKKK